jgi:hypothetical protein
VQKFVEVAVSAILTVLLAVFVWWVLLVSKMAEWVWLPRFST